MAETTMKVKIDVDPTPEFRVFVGAVRILADWLDTIKDRAHLILTSEELPEFIQDVQLLQDSARVLEGKLCKRPTRDHGQA